MFSHQAHLGSRRGGVLGDRAEEVTFAPVEKHRDILHTGRLGCQQRRYSSVTSLMLSFYLIVRMIP